MRTVVSCLMSGSQLKLIERCIGIVVSTSVCQRVVDVNSDWLVVLLCLAGNCLSNQWYYSKLVGAL